MKSLIKKELDKVSLTKKGVFLLEENKIDITFLFDWLKNFFKCVMNI